MQQLELWETYKQNHGFRTNNLQNSYEDSLGSDEQYTERINSNQYSEDQFMSDSGGYGLAQWTSSGRKQGLYRFVKDEGVGIDDENAQVEYLIGELTPGGNGYATYQLQTNNGYSPDDWINADSVEEATIAFCWTFERPGTPNMQARIDAALSYYEQFKDSEKPGGDARIGDISLSGDDATKMSEMLTDGLRMADDDSYIYVYGAGRPADENTRAFDCSSFVAYLYKKHFGITLPGTTYGYTNENLVGNIGEVELQPGDILWRDTHVAMYIGNNQDVEAMGTQWRYSCYRI